MRTVTASPVTAMEEATSASATAVVTETAVDGARMNGITSTFCPAHVFGTVTVNSGPPFATLANAEAPSDLTSQLTAAMSALDGLAGMNSVTRYRSRSP